MLTGAITGAGLPILGGTIGYQIGKHTYKPLSAEDMVAKHTHPMLMPPKQVKQKTKLEIQE